MQYYKDITIEMMSKDFEVQAAHTATAAPGPTKEETAHTGRTAGECSAQGARKGGAGASLLLSLRLVTLPPR